MIRIQKYSGQHVNDGVTVRGYAALSCESERAFILVPNKEDCSKFHIYEVKPDSLVPLL